MLSGPMAGGLQTIRLVDLEPFSDGSALLPAPRNACMHPPQLTVRHAVAWHASPCIMPHSNAGLLEAGLELLKVYSAEEALHLFIRSERVYGASPPPTHPRADTTVAASGLT